MSYVYTKMTNKVVLLKVGICIVFIFYNFNYEPTYYYLVDTLVYPLDHINEYGIIIHTYLAT